MEFLVHVWVFTYMFAVWLVHSSQVLLEVVKLETEFYWGFLYSVGIGGSCLVCYYWLWVFHDFMLTHEAWQHTFLWIESAVLCFRVFEVLHPVCFTCCLFLCCFCLYERLLLLFGCFQASHQLFIFKKLPLLFFTNIQYKISIFQNFLILFWYFSIYK